MSWLGSNGLGSNGLGSRWSASRRLASIAVAGLVGVVAAGCSSDDDNTAPVTADTVIAASTTDPAPTDPDPTTSVTSDAGDAAGPVTTVAEVTDDPDVIAVTIPEIGVPGLDSDVVVCRAWSRFAGSFQVVAVAASFGDDPLEAARLEVAASPVVTTAVDDMVENWPDELADEADAVADDFVGPYGRRSALALDALLAAGAEPDDLNELADVWTAALSGRDPTEVLPALELPGDLAELVEKAAVDFAARVVTIPQDPSLVTEVEIPRSEEFLFETCPDRGTLGGTEVEG
ncbi:hypothetical protein BH23ACT3_BH23ACT3_24180 [soil metagenome]